MQLCQLPDQAAKFAPVWTTFLKRRAIFVHQTSTEHAVCTQCYVSPVEGTTKVLFLKCVYWVLAQFSVQSLL